ncbi:hypothetical protein [Streptomyces violarus]|uniref:hypothetical protein n=1 Tax=Streptomyces violarus TaxID=67380 RepID=UPI0021BEE894|nr:hypothetical protein [Streptomyces violarus]MCT9145375.1 hypothetical protein [Streptomyces violarus]
MIAALLAAGAGFALGYAARSIRPLSALDTWAWDQVHRRARELRTGPARKRPGWWAAQAVFAVEVAALFIVRPRQMARQWRHRNDPPPRKSPPVIVTTTARH